MVQRVEFEFSFADLPMIRRQFFNRLAFAATVYQRQGKNLKKLLVDVRSNVFCAGHLYVALSRGRKA